tara:strand:+ start:505 stop:1248 length:744 start_codon:yes stop_codon:yes gene_type:complete
MMAPKSHTLFHFTKGKETLEKILKNGFWPRYCLEDIRWVDQSDADYIAFPMVCFCDIPLSRISEHVGFYGSFGLGMTKDWANKNSLNPLLYLASSNNLSSEIRSLNKHAGKCKTDDDIKDAKETMRYIYMHIKPSDGNMLVDGKPVEKEFYQESEWRFVPKNENIKPYMFKDKFDNEDTLNAENAKTLEHTSLKFTPDDIKYIFVKSDSDIPGIVNFIQTELDHFPAADLKILLSRIVSIESIQADL